MINISRATTMLAAPNICARACIPAAMTFFLWRQNDKYWAISLTSALSVLFYNT